MFLFNIGLFLYIQYSLKSFFLKRFYSFIFRERGREGEREGEKQQCVGASHMTLTGDLAHNPGMCPDWELNQWPFGSQASSPLNHTSQGKSFKILHFFF